MPIFDRAEDASFFAKYFSQFIANGVFPNPSNNMQVLAAGDMKVKVSIGTCFINGYMGWVDPIESFEIEESGLQPRIDRVVARLDFITKDIQIIIKKGVELGNPIPPELQRDYDIYEIGLADVRVNGNAVAITQENITDLRLNTELCGIVANHLQHLDTTTLFNQYEEWYRRVTTTAESDIATRLNNFDTFFTNFQTRTNREWEDIKATYIDGFEELKRLYGATLTNLQTLYNTTLENLKEFYTQDFDDWFREIQEVLDEDTAGHLLNMINENRTNITENAEHIEENTGNIENLQRDKSNNKKVYTISASGESWNGNEGPFTQEIEVEGMRDTDIANLDIIYSEDLETAIQEKEEYSKISKIVADTDKVILTCFEEIPEITLNLRIEVVY